MATITIDELHTYHYIDRKIFSRLVMVFMRDPAESLLIMATWLWLEDFGYPNIIMKMVDLMDALVNALADEAAFALRCLEAENPPVLPNGGMPLTARVMQRNFSLDVFYQNRFTAISGIKNFLNTVCARIFTDILQNVVPSIPQLYPDQPLLIPGFPHPFFGGATILPRSVDHDFPTGGLWGWQPDNNVTEDDRTMFLTFSRGFPVSRDEVTELFTKLYGNCIFSLQMQDNVPPVEQPLFARMVLNSVQDVDEVLNGRRIAKFRVNGKHIWARKYERRD